MTAVDETVVATLARRLADVDARLAAAGVDALLVGPGADLTWLAGFAMKLSERPTVLVTGPGRAAQLLTPVFEVAIAEREPVGAIVELHGWSDGDDAVAALADLLPRGAALAVADGFPAGWLLPLQAARPDLAWTSAAATLGVARMVKDATEVAALHAAGAAIDRVHAQVEGLLLPGRTEDAVARDLAERIAVEHDAVGFTIVGSGPNGAIPHHDHSARVLVEGDLVVVDIGGPRRGYWSDCTRTYVVGGAAAASAREREVAAAVLEANEVATAAVRPGVLAEDLDRLARATLAEVEVDGVVGGLDALFSHRLGHGIGLLGHERPYLVRGDATVLEPGMAFSVEPGVYLAGHWGVRVEDIVVVTEDGVERCNHRPRALA